MVDKQHTLAEQLAEVARALGAAEGVQETLQRTVDLSRETIEGCDHAGLSLLVEGRIETAAQTDPPVPQLIDKIQNDTGEGPGVDAIREHEVFETGDFSREQRWSRFAPAVVDQTGVRSALSMRLFIEQDTMGSLNLYAESVDAFDNDDRHVASIFAAHAAVGLRGAQHQQRLNQEAQSDDVDVIGEAKGLIMARQGVDAAAALQQLRDTAHRTNRPLREIAEQIIEGTWRPSSS